MKRSEKSFGMKSLNSSKVIVGHTARENMREEEGRKEEEEEEKWWEEEEEERV